MVCGPGRWGNRIVPDNPLGLVRFWRCCAWHDRRYAHPGKMDRREIDGLFLKCMLKQSADMPARWRRAAAAGMAWIYWSAVRLGGGRAWRRSRRE